MSKKEKQNHKIGNSLEEREEYERYLESIGFFRKLEACVDFSVEEIRKILVESIQKYLNGEVDQNFILGLGSTIHLNVISGAQIKGRKKDIEEIAASTCELDDLLLESYKEGRSKRSEQEIDLIIRNIFKNLTKGIKK